MVDLFDSLDVATPFEISGKPCIHNVESFSLADRSLAQRQDIAIIMRSVPNGDLLVPAEPASDPRDAVGYDGFSIA